jgi:hypothetical protein
MVPEVDLVAHPVSYCRHLTSELMAGDDRIRGGRKVSIGNVDIGPADVARSDRGHHLTGPAEESGTSSTEHLPSSSKTIARMILITSSVGHSQTLTTLGPTDSSSSALPRLKPVSVTMTSMSATSP